MISMKIEGGRDLAKNLALLPKAVSRKVQIAALTEGGQPIQRTASSLAPRDQGSGPHLADNIVISAPSAASLEKRERFDETVVEVGPARKPHDVFYGYFQEFGTAFHPAQSFMRPAFDQNAPLSINRILSAFWIAIRKVLPQSTTASGFGSRAA